jgi:hypothetical protein
LRACFEYQTWVYNIALKRRAMPRRFDISQEDFLKAFKALDGFRGRQLRELDIQADRQSDIVF